MPFTEPIKATDPIETVKKIARLATMLLELRDDYNRRQRDDILEQIQHWAAELHALAQELPVNAPAPIEKSAEKQN